MPVTASAFAASASTTREIRECLARYVVDDLRALLLVAGLPRDGRKAELVDRLVAHVTDDSCLAAVCDSLAPLELAAVADAVHRDNGEHDARAFEARHGSPVDWGWTRSSSMWSRERTGPSMLQILFCDRSTLTRRRSIPHVLREKLKVHVEAPAAAVLQTLPDQPAAWRPTVDDDPYDFDNRSDAANSRNEDDPGLPLLVVQTEAVALAESQAMLRLVQTGKLSIGEKTGRPSTASLRAVSGILVGGDFYDSDVPADWSDKGWDRSEIGPIRAMAWPLLLRAGALAKPFGSKLRLTKAGTQALSAQPADVLRDLWNSWLGTTALDEFSRIDCIKGQTGKGRRCLTAAASRRDAIGDALADCPVGRWVAIDELFRHMRATGLDFEVVHRDPWNLYIGGQHYGSLGYDGCHSWSILQARYALAMLLEYAATLGMIDVALIPPHEARPDYSHMWGTDDLPFLSRYDGLACLRFTPLGAYCLGLRDEYQPPTYAGKAVLEVLSSKRVLAAPGATIAAGDRLLLGQFATPDVDGQCWRLERSRLLAAIEQGRSVDEVRDFLTARSDQPLPPIVETLLTDTATRSRAVRNLGSATLLECAEGVIAAQICESPQAKKLSIMRAGARHIVVPSMHDDRFVRLVRDLGYGICHGAIAKDGTSA